MVTRLSCQFDAVTMFLYAIYILFVQEILPRFQKQMFATGLCLQCHTRDNSEIAEVNLVAQIVYHVLINSNCCMFNNFVE